jgi:hypothetical protein
MLALAEGSKPVLGDVQSLTDWLWYINAKGSLAEAVAATSFAIEGATGELARKVMSGFESYSDNPRVDFGPKTYKWMKEHARYDDEHPKIALEIVKRYAVVDRMQTRVMLATRRSLQLLHQALLTSYRAYSVAPASNRRPDLDLRVVDRRIKQMVLTFPDRRFRERRHRGLRFGRRLFEIFFKTYSEKLWGIPCSELDADFAAQRIKKFSLGEAIRSAFGRKRRDIRGL